MNETKTVMPLRDVDIFKFNLPVNLAKVSSIKLKMVYLDVSSILFNPLDYLKINGSDDQLELVGFNGHLEQGRCTVNYEYVFAEQQLDLEEEVEIEIKTNCNYSMVEEESWFEITTFENE